MTSTDTVFALSSGAGRCAVSVIRVSGPACGSLLCSLIGKMPKPRELALRVVRHPRTGEQLDKALSALIGDLGQRGMLKDTLVVVATEFGRTPVINSNLGRDHYPKAFSGAMFGGGVKGGTVIGSTDKTGGEVEGEPVLLPDFNATIAYALGLPIQESVISPSLRPFKIANKGVPVTQIFA